MSGLVKLSERTVRRPCWRCKSQAMYWARPVDADPNDRSKLVLVDATPATTATAKGTAFPTDAPIHGCRKTQDSTQQENTQGVSRFDDVPAYPTPEQTDAQLVAAAVVRDGVSTPEPVATPEPVSTPEPDTDEAKALATLRGLLGGSVDEEQVRAIVRQELDGQLFPTRTVVIRESTKQVTRVDGPTHYAFAEVLEWLAAGEHVLMVGPAGTGKSTIGRQAAQALGIPFGAISLNPQTPKSELFGYIDATGTYRTTVFRKACDEGHLFLADEFDNGHGGILAGLNMALANGMVAFPDGMVELNEDFRFVAGANTDGRGAKGGYVRQRLDYATLDRFNFVHVGYDEALEAELVRATGISKADGVRVLTAVRQARANVDAAGMDLVYSPRAAQSMAKGMVHGKSWQSVVAARLRRGLTEQEWSKVGSGIAA